MIWVEERSDYSWASALSLMVSPAPEAFGVLVGRGSAMCRAEDPTSQRYLPFAGQLEEHPGSHAAYSINYATLHAFDWSTMVRPIARLPSSRRHGARARRGAPCAYWVGSAFMRVLDAVESMLVEQPQDQGPAKARLFASRYPVDDRLVLMDAELEAADGVIHPALPMMRARLARFRLDVRIVFSATQ